MVNWLKFYFLGFFSNELSKDGAARNFFNTLLSVVIAFVAICGGLIAGYSLSFGIHYSNAEEFRNFLYSAFASENVDSRIGLVAEGGKVSASFNGEKEYVNSLSGDDGEYLVNGYRLIVDTREAATAFDDFTVVCKDSDGSEISYEEYRALSEEEKSNGTFTVQYSGKALDVRQKQAEYVAFIDRISEPSGAEYNTDVAVKYAKLKQDLSSGLIGQTDYDNEIYVLYVEAYYPDIKDAYGGAPTLKTYYLSATTYQGLENYFVLLDDVCFCSFHTKSGISVEFSGYFSGLKYGVISDGNLSREEICDNVDEMINKSFQSSGTLNFLIYLISVSRMIPMFAAFMLLAGSLMFLVCRMKHLEFGQKYMGAIKVIGSYLFMGSIFTFILSIVYSFFLPRGTVYNLTLITFIAVLILRSAILLVMEIIKVSQEKLPENRDNAN